MKKILIVGLLSVIIFGVASTLILVDSWSSFKYRFFTGFINGLILFVLVTALYHLILKLLQAKVNFLNSLLGQVGLSVIMSLALMAIFVAIESVTGQTKDQSVINTMITESRFAFGVGLTISIVYYLITKLFSTKR